MNEDKPALGGKDMGARPSRARYDKVKTVLDMKWRRRQLQAERMMRDIVDQLWDNFGGQPWSWCGFWILQPDGRAFQPAASRPAPAGAAKPAEGAIAEALKSGSAKPGAVEIFVPAYDKTGRVWAVLEARSGAAFDDMDARWLERLLKAFQDIERPLPQP